jgi:hypothetical protein
VATPLNATEIRAMADEWFKLLDAHAAEVYLLPHLAQDVVQKWPDYDVQNIADFEGWYQRALRLFFDESHVIKAFDVKVNGDGSQAEVKVVVNWDAKSWTPGAAKSKHLWMDAYQTWQIIRSEQTGKPIMKHLTVDDIKLMEGADSL